MNLGYLVSRYPLITETFVLREMVELEKLGHHVRVAPLIKRMQTPVKHGDAVRFERDMAFFPLLSWKTLAANLRVLCRRPATYLATLFDAIRFNRGDARLLAGALACWPRAVAIADAFERDGIEHVHAHFATHPAFGAWAIHRLTGIPYSFTAHAHDIYVHREMLAAKVDEARFVVTISDFNRNLIVERCPGISHSKVNVIRCGVAMEKYRDLRVDSAASASGVTRPLRLLTVASLQPYKGHAVLIDALARLAGRMAFEARFVGTGELRDELQARISEAGLQHRVNLVGALDEAGVRRELAAADVMVLPSVQEASGKMEGIPVALMEAMAAGLPVVASRLSGIPELVIDGQNGYLCAPGDSDAFASAIWALQDADLRLRLGRQARAHVARDFDLHRSARALSDLFEARGAAAPARLAS